MSNLTVARRYAQALYEEAAGSRRVEKVDEDMEVIRATLAGSSELVRFFESPVISREKKEAVVRALFEERLDKATFNFLRLLIGKKREHLFPDVVQAYRELRNEQLGIREARARVAYPMSAEEEKTLVAALEQLSGSRIRLTIDQDPHLIGGVVVRIGDTVYDGSVRHQLASLRERMERGSFAAN